MVSIPTENCALLPIENCTLLVWGRTPRLGVEIVGLDGVVGNRVDAATATSLARQPQTVQFWVAINGKFTVATNTWDSTLAMLSLAGTIAPTRSASSRAAKLPSAQKELLSRRRRGVLCRRCIPDGIRTV